jgi:kumamolisin
MATKKKARKSPVRRQPGRSSKEPAHVLVPGSKRPPVKFASRIGDVDPGEPVEVTLTLRGRSLPGADELPAKSLTPAEFEEQYGASRSDVDTVTKVLGKYGLTVKQSSLVTRSIQVTGSAQEIESAFRPTLGIYRDSHGNEFRDREGTYAVPKEISGIVTGVIGLGQRPVARRRARAAAKAAKSLKPLAPADIEKLYNFPAQTEDRQNIGIAEFGGGFFADDLAKYCQKYGRNVPAVNAVSVNRPAYTLQEILQLPDTTRKDELDSSVEVMMDVEVISGLCSNSTINVYFATFDQKGWVDLLNRVIEDRPVVLSVSWGMAEDDVAWSKAARDAINDRLNAAAVLGITVCVSSGDDGSGDEETDDRAHVDFPASSPFTLGVGGTMLSAPLSPASEVVWWESPGRRTGNGGGSTGGGVSTLFDRPKWQTVKIKSLNKGSIDGRVVPDVAAVAGDPLYDLIVLGRDSPNGGTSAAAPVWAALITRIDANLPSARRQRFLTPLLYQTIQGGKPVGAVGCNDITSGNNVSRPHPGKGYTAGTGFDAVTGWGTPNGTALQSILSTV